MKIVKGTLCLLLCLFQVTLASSKADLTLDLIEIDVELGPELRAELKQACGDPKVLTHDILIPVVEKYAEEMGEQVFYRLNPWIWFISAELIRAVASITRPEGNYSVLDDLKMHFKPSTASNVERNFFYICYELIAKIIFHRGLDRKIVKNSLKELIKSNYCGGSDTRDYERVTKEIFEFLFKTNSGEKRKLSGSESASSTKKSRLEAPDVSESQHDSEISSLDSVHEIEGKELYPLFYHSSEPEEASKSDWDSSEFEESRSSNSETEIKITIRTATEILSNPEKARNRREIKDACSVYLGTQFRDAEEAVLVDVFDVITHATRRVFF